MESRGYSLSRLSKKDAEILEGLYTYRALSTDQIMRRYGMTESYTYKRLSLLRRGGFISSVPIKGYIPNKKSQGKYHRITESGITALRNEGMYVHYRAFQLQVKNERMIPYLLTTNELMTNLEPFGWQLSDGREVKSRFNLNRNDAIQGMIHNIETGSEEYAIYVLLNRTNKKTIAKIVREISNYKRIHDFMIFTKGKESFNDILVDLMSAEKGNIVAKRKSIKLFPFSFGIEYFRNFSSEEDVLSQIIKNTPELGLEFKRRLSPEEITIPTLNTIVKHNGEEKYFVNLMDTDLRKIYDVKQYRREIYQRTGRKVLVLTHIRSKHEELLNMIHHVEYLDIDIV